PKSKYGAWEITYRQSEIALKKEDQVIRSKTIGLNYYFRKSTKLMFNYIEANNHDKDELVDGKAYSLRFQYSF
ncbi:MAG: OprO/OprP family phosphate-selective porin, partial [Kangiellaceae bacterium]|nr:OprO/OprP family phosphate-selective porin [Kangiellaceae bacterium]